MEIKPVHILLLFIVIAAVGAIALVVFLGAGMAALGVFDTSNFVGNKSAGFSQVEPGGWSLTSGGTLRLKLTNNVGAKIRIDSVSATVGGKTKSISPAVELNTGDDSGTLSLPGFAAQATGTGYTARVIINYTDLNLNFPYSTSGTLTGKVE